MRTIKISDFINHVIHFRAAMSEVPRTRMHILLRSTEQNLQNERSLFEINSNTTMKELKQAIIERLDERQVTRTFLEQVVLSFQDRVISNDHNTDEFSVAVALDLTDGAIREMNNVIPLSLEVKSVVNGILSREFWHDITANDRFDFLPIINQDIEEEQTGNTEIENEQTENAEIESGNTVPPDMALVEPMKIVADDDRVWKLTGTTYESISDGQGSAKLVNQDDLSQKIFEMSSASNPNEMVKLSTSQCIIVDNEGQQPYMLLSPAGIAKVDSVFKLQKVKVVLHNPQTAEHEDEEDREELEDDTLERVVSAGKRFLAFATKVAVALFILGYRPNKHMQENWIKYLIMILVLFNFYVLFFTGANRVQRVLQTDPELARQPPATQNFIRGARGLATTRQNIGEFVTGMQNELVAIVVSRTFDFEYLMSNNPNWYIVFASNFENLWKDALIYMLTLLPTFQFKLYDELHKRKRMELKLFKDKVRLFYDLVLLLIQEYNKKHTPNFDLPEEVDIDTVLEKLETVPGEEDQYACLVKYYKVLKPTYDLFNKLYVKHLSLTEEQVEYLNSGFDSLEIIS